MKRNWSATAVLIVGVIACGAFGSASAQEAQAQTKGQTMAEAAANPVPLKVTVVISRFQGDKQVSSLPFVLTLNANDRTSLRMGAEVPVPASVASGAKDGTSQASYSYRPIGTQIDCRAGTMTADGRVPLNLTVNDSQVAIDNSPEAGTMRGLPRFASFISTATLALSDGAKMEYAAATDKISGEVVRVSVTMNVLK